MKAELGRGSRCGGHPSPAFAQRSLNPLFLLASQPLREFQLGCRLGCTRVSRKPTRIHRKILCFADYDRALNDVLQFANISRPRIGQKQVQSFLVYPTEVLSGLSCEMMDEVLHQQRNVFSSFPQRRNLNGENVEAVKQIAAKCTRSDGSLQVAIGGSDDPHVSSNCLIATNTLKLPLLQNTQ